MSSLPLKLYIGTRRYSSWSLRPWLLLAHFAPQHALDFETSEILLDTDAFPSQVRAVSPTSRVPVLHDGDLVIWDSLAICEYLNERYFAGQAWPKAKVARAFGRSMTAEMHSGFSALRSTMPMDLHRSPALPELGVGADQQPLQADIRRICALWRESLARFGGPYLLGEFSMADCFFAPVCTRFKHYAAETLPFVREAGLLGRQEQDYIARIIADPHMQEWYAASYG